MSVTSDPYSVDVYYDGRGVFTYRKPEGTDGKLSRIRTRCIWAPDGFRKALGHLRSIQILDDLSQVHD